MERVQVLVGLLPVLDDLRVVHLIGIPEDLVVLMISIIAGDHSFKPSPVFITGVLLE